MAAPSNLLNKKHKNDNFFNIANGTYFKIAVFITCTLIWTYRNATQSYTLTSDFFGFQYRGGLTVLFIKEQYV